MRHFFLSFVPFLLEWALTFYHFCVQKINFSVSSYPNKSSQKSSLLHIRAHLPNQIDVHIYLFFKSLNPNVDFYFILIFVVFHITFTTILGVELDVLGFLHAMVRSHTS